MYIALRLLRDGAHTTITTRFPKDAVRRFSSLPDSGDWTAPAQGRRHRPARPHPGHLARRRRRRRRPARHPGQQRLPDRTPHAGRLRASWSRLEDAPLPTGTRMLPEMVTFDRISEAHPAAIAGALSTDTAVAHHEGESAAAALAAHNAATMTALALKAGPRLARRAPRRHGRRRRRPAARHADQQLVDPDRRRGRPAGAPRGAAVQLDRAVPAGLAPAPGAAPPPCRRPARGGRTSSTSRRWRASSPAATRAPATRTPTWPRPRST